MRNLAPITLCGSLSRHPVSLGAAMHRAGYAALGLEFSYVPFAVTDLQGALVGMRALGIRGFGVSMPFKLEVMPHLDRLDDLARRIGSVNTIVNDDGLLTGYNTDASGARRALEEAISLPGHDICLIGAGGAARAVAYALADAGSKLHIVNRTEVRAHQLAREIAAQGGISVTAGPLADLGDLGRFQVLVNASSAGMAEYGSTSPVPAEGIHRDLVVMDIVYKPLKTPLLVTAEQRGARTVHGGRMLLHQACGQFELYTLREAPVPALEAALDAAISAQS